MSLKAVMNRIIVITLAVALVFGSSITLRPTGVSAAEETLPGIISNANKMVTLDYNQDISANSSSILKDGIDIKLSGDSRYHVLGSSDVVSIVDTKIQIDFDEALPKGDFMIRVDPGYVQDAQGDDLGEQVFVVIVNDLIQMVSNSWDPDDQKVTLTFNQPITQVGDNDAFGDMFWLYSEYLYTGIGSLSVMLKDLDMSKVEISGNTMTFVLGIPLTYKLEVQIQPGALMDSQGQTNTQLYFDVALRSFPDIEGVYTQSDNYDVILNFEGLVFNNTESLEDLKSKFQVSQGGVNADIDFVKIEEDIVTIHLFTPLQLEDYRVQVEAGALKSISGTANSVIDVTTNDRNDSDLVYKSSEVKKDTSTGKYTISLTFDDLLDSYFDQSRMYFTVPGMDDRNPLSPLDEVTISGNTLNITFDQPFTTSKIRIVLSYDSISNTGGYNLNGDLYTEYLDVEDEGGPVYRTAYFTNMNQDVVLVFHEPIQDHTGGQLKAAIEYAVKNRAMNELDHDAVVSIQDNKVIIHFQHAFDASYYQFSIAANALSDLNGNVLGQAVRTDPVIPKDLTKPNLREGYYSYYISSLKSTAAYLYFDKSIYDNTMDIHGVSHLKDAIEISSDGGQTFSALGAEDWVKLSAGESQLTVFIHSKVQPSIVIKVKGNAVKDEDGNVAIEDQFTNSYYSDFSLSGRFYTDVDSEFIPVGDNEWLDHVYRITLKTDDLTTGIQNTWKELSPDQYEVDGDKIIINSGTFNIETYYEIRVYAYGYDTEYIYGYAHPQNETYYMSPTVIQTNGGITASVNILMNEYRYDYYGELSSMVIFQLMKGSTPVANIPVNLGSYNDYNSKATAYFYVSDPTNPEYHVRVFIVDEYDNGEASVSMSLGRALTQEEYEKKSSEYYNS